MKNTVKGEKMHVKILKADAIANCIAAYREKRLGYQTGQKMRRYRYNDDTVCVIGASMPKGFAENYLTRRHMQGFSVRELYEHYFVKTDDIKFLIELQDVYLELLKFDAEHFPEVFKANEQKLLKLLGI